MALEIRPAYANIEEIRALFSEYTAALGIDLSFQDYAHELEELPGKYAPPGGRLYLALLDGAAVGCVALRPIDGERCEMKRLYVRPECRGRRVGEQLVHRLMDDARQIGYRQMLLDTLATMESAVGLYTKLGFTKTEPYYHNPIEGAVYMSMDL